MKNFKKVIAVLCSATMILGSTLTAFAADPDTAAGDGNILVFSVETVTLPTSVKVAFNPNGYNVTPKDGATAVTDQIVSLKYGIASTANKDRKVTVSFTATGVTASGHTGTGDVEFVDDIKKAQAYVESTNEDGAKYGEYKIYLAVAGSAAAPKKDASNAFAPADFGTDALTATKAALADATFTAATKGLVAFDGNATKAETAIAYKLDKATYTQKSAAGSEITFATTQADMADKFDLTALGTNGVVGFTFTGAMNPNADWTKAKITALKIQPEYEIVDADGSEEVEETGSGNGQIKITAAATDDYKMVKEGDTYVYAFVTAPTGSITALSIDGTSRIGAVNNGFITYANGKLTISKTAVDAFTLTTGDHTIAYTIGSSSGTLTIDN